MKTNVTETKSGIARNSTLKRLVSRLYDRAMKTSKLTQKQTEKRHRNAVGRGTAYCDDGTVIDLGEYELSDEEQELYG